MVDTTTLSSLCAQKVGVFLVRICRVPAVANCSKCGCSLCLKHRRLEKGSYFCSRCLPHRQSNDYDSFTENSSSSSSPSSDDSSWSGQGGTFAGAGAVGSWDSEAPVYENASPSDNSVNGIVPIAGGDGVQGFSAQEIAAFSKVSSADKEVQSGSYDS